ncbi:MAG: nitroreductase family protein [Desulfovibrionaceae bacterium]
MDFTTLVHQARTCRRFHQSPALSPQNLAFLVDCARVSPCARNAQVLRFSTISSPEGCAALFPHTRWAGALKEGGTPPEGQRPSGYIAVLWPVGCNALVHIDAGIAAQTMQLAAKSKGWGCCMHASFDRTHCPHIFQVPEGLEMALLLAFGVANENCVLEPMPANGSFAYWRDADLGHHVPKRALDEVLLRQV